MTRDRVILSLSFLFAFLMWVPQKLTKNYRHSIPLKVSMDLPADRQLIHDQIKIFPIEIEGKGSHLFNLTGAIKTDTLLIPLTTRSLTSTITADEIITKFRSVYQVSQEITVRPTLSQLGFDLDSVQIKTVAIQPNFKTSFLAGHGQIGSPTLEPDRVTITGPFDVVSKISSISTSAFEFIDLAKPTTKDVSLQLDSTTAEIGLSVRKTLVTIDVDELVEQELIVPVNNFQDEGKTWNLFPDQILVRLSVPLRFVQEINASHVKLKLVSQGSQAVSVEVNQIPKHANYINHSPKILRYFEQEVDSLQ